MEQRIRSKQTNKKYCRSRMFSSDTLLALNPSREVYDTIKRQGEEKNCTQFGYRNSIYPENARKSGWDVSAEFITQSISEFSRKESPKERENRHKHICYKRESFIWEMRKRLILNEASNQSYPRLLGLKKKILKIISPQSL